MDYYIKQFYKKNVKIMENFNLALCNKKLPTDIVNYIYTFYTKNELTIDKKTLNDKLPENITHIIIKDKYNEIISPTTFPFSYQYSLKEIHIDISSNYNSPFIKYSIPSSVSRIIINNKYNKEFSNDSFPIELKELFFSSGSMYKTEISNDVFYEKGENMKLLILSGYYNSSISFIKNLKKLEVLSFDIQVFYLTDIIRKSEYNYYDKSFTKTFIKIEKEYEKSDEQHWYLDNDEYDFNEINNSSSYFNQIIIPNFLPNTLKELYLSKSYNIKLEPGVLPNGLKVLALDYGYKHDFDIGVLPQGLEVLVIDNLSNLKPNVLPSSLKELYIKTYESDSEGLNVGDLPNSLEIISINNYFCKNKITKNIFPSNLRKFYTHMNIKYIVDELPDSIELLSFPNIQQNIKLFNIFPKNLKKIVVNKIYAIRFCSWMKRLPNDVIINFA